MAARHFAEGALQKFEHDIAANEGNTPSAPVASEPGIEPEPAAKEAPRGRHFKKPVVEYVPTIPISTFEVPVSENDEADAQARARIEEILRELEAPPAPPVPEPETVPDPEPVPELEKPAQPAPAAAGSAAPAHALDPNPASDPGSDPAPTPTPEAPLDATSDLHSGNKARKQDEQGGAQPDASSNELETTAVIDYEAVRSAVGQAEEDEGDEQVSTHRRERLEVGSGFYVPPNNSKSRTDASLATRRPRLGFFAAIGEFIARLFHMDD